MAGNIDKLKQIIGMVGKDPYEGMTPQEKKLAKLEGVFKLLDDGVTKQEFEKNLTEILKLMKAMKENSAMEVSAMKEALRSSLDNLNGTHETLLNDARGQIDSLFVEGKLSEIDKKQNDAIARLDERLSTLRDGVDGNHGKDADENGILFRLLDKVPVQKKETAENVRDLLETLKGDERLDAKYIKGLEQFIKDNMPQRVGGAGIGLNAFSTTKLEATGTIDGVNATFNFGTKPALVVVNGATYDEGYGWTYSLNTVVLDNPPPLNSRVYGIK